MKTLLPRWIATLRAAANARQEVDTAKDGALAVPPRRARWVLLVLIWLLPIPSCWAARVSEPHSLFYGRIYQRVGDQHFVLNQGELKWTIGSPDGSYHDLAATIGSPGQGRYSYVLRIPHQLLAFDLTLSGPSVPLTASATRFQHLQISINGRPGIIVAPAVDGFTASQASRGGAYRIDLEVPNLSPDSDGDGIPDWWEDQYGTDKWDPLHGPLAPPAPGSAQNQNRHPDAQTTFAQWRTAHFPTDTRDLDLFGAEDYDGDGLVNLVEYAFGLDPANPDESKLHWPRHEKLGEQFLLTFERRRDAEDIEYTVQISEDLVTWRDASPEIEITGIVQAERAFFSRVSVRQRQPARESPCAYLRVSIIRKPH